MKNSKTLTVCFVLFPFLMLPASALELRIYSTFSEFRTPVTLEKPEYNFELPYELLSQMVPGSLRLEGLPVLSQTMRPVNRVDSWKLFEGKTVILRVGDKRIPVKLIDSVGGIVQEVDTGDYRYGVKQEDLSFPSLFPSQKNVSEHIFLTERAGLGTLSYLSRAVSWSPQYTLEVDAQGKADLESWASINNNTSSEIKIDKIKLVAGNVKISEDSYTNGYNSRSSISGLFDASRSLNLMVNINPNSTENIGTYIFDVDRGISIPAASKYLLPFIKPKIQLERLIKIIETTDNNRPYLFQSSDRPDLYILQPHRIYRISSDALIPLGMVTIRESGIVVGQTSIPDTAKTALVDLDIGLDSGIISSRKRSRNFREKKVETCYYGSTSQCDMNYYNNTISLSLINTKDRPITFEYRAGVDNYFFALEGVGKMENPSVYFLRDILPANSSKTFEYTFITRER